MKKLHKGTIKNIEKIARDTFKIEIASGLERAEAGQFISILCPPKTLRRPFSIAGFKNGVITVLFKLKGDGTNYIKSLKKGDSVDFLGAMGHGFEIQNKKSLLIGAGIGIAPMLFLKDTLDAKGIENYLVSGFKADDEVIEGACKNIIGGSILNHLDKFIEEFKPEILYSCGPEIVLKGVFAAAKKHGLKCYIAMEKVFACSIGVCRGCVIKIKDNEGVKNATICHDGPVFDAGEVIWE